MNTTAFALPVIFKSIYEWITSNFFKKTNIAAASNLVFGPIIHESHQTISAAELQKPNVIKTVTHQKPVRVVQVFDLQQTKSTTGRIVISGRMADVCAELDRLAALEAA
jgi:hypothetical protein